MFSFRDSLYILCYYVLMYCAFYSLEGLFMVYLDLVLVGSVFRECAEVPVCVFKVFTMIHK